MSLLAPIKEFIMKPNLPIQVVLYSCPGVNLVVRYIQNSCCFDILGKENRKAEFSYPKEKVKAFNDQQAIFRRAISISYATQATLFITTFALAILYPPGGIPLALAQANIAFLGGIITLCLVDGFWYKSNRRSYSSSAFLEA